MSVRLTFSFALVFIKNENSDKKSNLYLETINKNVGIFMDITIILGFETKKMLEILTFLQQQSREVPLKKLADEMSVHVKTVVKYVGKLQVLINEYRLSEQLSLSVQKRDRLLLEMENPWYLEKFRIDLIERTPEIMILDKIISSSFNIKEFSIQLKESEPQVKKRVTKIRRWLQPLRLTLKRNTYELVGDEVQVREFVHQFYRIRSYNLNRTKEPLYADEIERIYRKIVLFFDMRLNYLQEQQLLSIISIQHTRFESGKSVTISDSLKNYCLNSPLYASLTAQLKQRNKIMFSVDEYMYLFLVVQSKFSENFSQTQKEKFIYENYINKTTAYIQAAYGAQLLKNSFKEHDFLFDKHVYTSLLSFHLYYELTDFLLYEDISLFKQLLITYPVLFSKLNKGFRQILTENSHFQRITKAQLLFRYFFIFSEMLSPVLLERQKNIYLVLDWGSEQKEYLIQTISSYFKNKKNLRFVDGKIYSEYKNADVILTTAIHPFFIEQKLDCPVLTVTELSVDVLLKQLDQILAD